MRELWPQSWRGRAVRRWLAVRRLALAKLSPTGADDLTRIRRTRALTPLLMQDAAALHLVSCARAASSLPGAMAEAGVFKGGSARLICEVKGSAQLHLFDVFELLQDAAVQTGETGEVRDYFGAVHSCLGEVQALLTSYKSVEFHPGHFPQSVTGLSNETRFSFVHLDLDLGRGTRDALEYFWRRIVPGGVLIGDDYNLPAVREAFAKFFAGDPACLIEMPWPQVMVTKLAP